MKRLLFIGVVLLALIALTGIVSADTTGIIGVYGDVQSSSLSLITSGSTMGWTMTPGINTRSGPTVMVTNNGYASGYTVSVADKLDIGKPVDTAGYLTPYREEIGMTYGAHKLSHPLAVFADANPSHTNVLLSGSDQPLYTTSVDGLGASDTYTPVFSQTIVGSDKTANTYSDCGSHTCNGGYAIWITFTATAN